MIWTVIGDMLPAALAAALSIGSIIGVVVILTGTGGIGRAVVFAAGNALAIGLVLGAGVALSSGASEPQSTADTGVKWLSLVVGALMLWLAVHNLRAQFRPDAKAQEPKWLAKLDSITLAGAAALGGTLGVLNAKNLPLIITQAGAIGQAGLGSVQAAIVCASFGLVATLGVAIPVFTTVVRGAERARPLLDAWRSWLTRNNHALLGVLFLIMGARAFGTGLGSLLHS